MRSMKRSLITALALVLALFALSLPTAAQSPSTQAQTQRDARLFRLEDLRAGTEGTARTAVSGTEAGEAGVGVRGVLLGWAAPCPAASSARGGGRQVAG